MELVKLWYKYLNRFINSDELLEELQNLNLNKYTIDTKSDIKILIKNIKKIKDGIPNEFDEIEENRIKNIDFFLEKLKTIDRNNCDKDSWKVISKEIKDLKKEKLIVRDGGALYNSILGDIVGVFLPIVDNLENAVKAETKDTEYKKGVELVLKQFKDILKTKGVEEIESVGKTFDPSQHEAISSIQDPEKGVQEIVQEYRKGYKIGSKVIRHSMVVVAN